MEKLKQFFEKRKIVECGKKIVKDCEDIGVSAPFSETTHDQLLEKGKDLVNINNFLQLAVNGCILRSQKIRFAFQIWNTTNGHIGMVIKPLDIFEKDLKKNLDISSIIQTARDLSKTINTYLEEENIPLEIVNVILPNREETRKLSLHENQDTPFTEALIVHI